MAVIPDRVPMGLLFGLTGPPAAGKDAAALYLIEAHGFERLAFADEIRRAALVLDPYVGQSRRLSEIVAEHGWDYCKSNWLECRRLLQVLGTELGRDLHGPDTWVDRVFDAVHQLNFAQHIVITDVRFENEAAAVRSHGGRVVRLNRSSPSPDVVMAHLSEVESAGICPDYVIPNHGDLAQLHGHLDRLVTRSLALRRMNA